LQEGRWRVDISDLNSFFTYYCGLCNPRPGFMGVDCYQE
jgi:hypothetical protein